MVVFIWVKVREISTYSNTPDTSARFIANNYLRNIFERNPTSFLPDFKSESSDDLEREFDADLLIVSMYIRKISMQFDQ